MKAVFYERDSVIRVGEVAAAHPRDDEIQIRVAFGGICGTDLGIYHGKMDWRVGKSQILGHEISGTIEKLGKGVSGFRVGDPVTVMPLKPCGHCPACLAGHSHICHNLKFIGIDEPGGFQDFWNVPAACAFKLPPTVALERGALIEPIAVACHDVRMSDLRQGEVAVVLGGGPIGALIGLVAKDRGSQVIVSEINPHRSQILRELGLEVIDPRTCDLVRLVEERSEGAGADVVFEVTGHPSGIEIATKLPRTRGRIVVVGIFGTPPPVDLFRLFWRELRLLGARVYEKQDFERAIQLAAEGNSPFDRLISDVLPMHEAFQGIRRMDAGGNVMKILLKWDQITPSAT